MRFYGDFNPAAAGRNVLRREFSDEAWIG